VLYIGQQTLLLGDRLGALPLTCSQPDGTHEFGYLPDPEPLGGIGSAPDPDPKLYATYDGAMGEPGPALGTETGLAGKIKDKLS
jgi:Mn-containing catalase